MAFAIDGTGISAGDYTLTDADGETVTSPVTLMAGETSVALTLTAVDDSDAVETLTFTLSPPAPGARYMPGAPAAAMVTINPQLTVAFSSNQFDVAEAAGMVAVSVQLSGVPSTAVTVPIIVGGEGAMEGVDYMTPNPALVVFQPDASASLVQTLMIAIVNDTHNENNERFRVSFGPLPTGVSAGTPSEAQVNILDDDIPSVNFASATATTDEDNRILALTVQLTGAAVRDLMIPIRTVAGTATADSDYTPLPAGFQVSLDAGATTGSVEITILNDREDEIDETFTVAFGAGPLPTGVSAGSTPAVTVTITDDDIPELSVTAAPDIDEGMTRSITITSDRAPATDLSVGFAVTGVDGADYRLTDAGGNALTTPVTLASGATSVAVRLMAVDDDDATAETLTFTLSPPGSDAGYTLGATAAATVTINPIRQELTVEFSSAAAVMWNESATGMLPVTMRLSASPVVDVVIPIATGGSATAGVDYTVPMNITFAAGTATLTQTVPVTVTADNAIEGNEVFTLAPGTLPSNSSLRVSAGTANKVTVTIIDDDIAVSFVPVTPSSITESETAVTVNLQLSAPAATTISIPIRLGGTATQDSDYQIKSTTVVFAAGEFRPDEALRILVLDDTDDETDETITLNFGTPLPANVSAAGVTSVQLTIVDNDDAPAPVLPSLSLSVMPSSIAVGDGLSIAINSDRAMATNLDVNFSIAGVPRTDYQIQDTEGNTPTLVSSRGNTTVYSTRLRRGRQTVEFKFGLFRNLTSAESMTITLQSNAAYELGQAQAQVRIGK